MIRHITDQELMALSLHQLNLLELQLRELLKTLDPASADTDTVRVTINRLVRIRAIKRRRPSPR